MIFQELSLPGAFAIEPQKNVDERGTFTRIWCAREFETAGIRRAWVQSSLSTNLRRGTLRGMHYSVPPRAEAKLVRCVRGAVYDVLLDLRAGSPTFSKWIARTLSADNALALYIPEGVAHGFQTLEDDSTLLYQMSEFYDPACARGVRWNDPAFDVSWPKATRSISERDAAYPDFQSGQAVPFERAR